MIASRPISASAGLRAALCSLWLLAGCAAQEAPGRQKAPQAPLAPQAPSARAAPASPQPQADSFEPYRSLTGEFKVAGVEQIPMRVLARHPHSTEAFTEGLVFVGDRLFESTGPDARGSLRLLRLDRARPEREVPLWAPDFFAEGIASDGKRILQISYTNERALVWDAATMTRVGEFGYKGGGWGLCYTGALFIRSDGSSDLHFHDPATFAERRVLTVTLGGRPLKEANELECDRDTLWANIWFRPEIVRVDLRSGAVTGLVDARPLIEEVGRHDDDDVINGIARDPRTGHFFLTGKMWPTIFEVELQPGAAGTNSPP